MKNFFGILGEVIFEMIMAILYFIENNLRNFANILNIICPYVMYLLAWKGFVQRGEFAVGGEIFVPIVFAVLIFLIRQFANKVGKGTNIPVPRKRFTEEDDEGEVSVEQNRLQEMILYVADLEDWLERKGLIK